MPVRRTLSLILATALLALTLGLGSFHTGGAQAGRLGETPWPAVERLRFDHLTLRDGLSQNTVHAILQDRSGFLWFGTEAGLDLYDGYQFIPFQRDLEDPGSLPHNTVLALCEDSNGTLWVGTQAGLASFDRLTNRFTPLGGAELGPVQALAEDQGGRLWIGTTGNGLWELDRASGALQRSPLGGPGPALPSVYDILAARSGEIWIATANGLERYLPETDDFEHYRQVRTDPNTPSSSRVRSLVEDDQGSIWMGTDGGGLNRLEPQTGAFTFYLHGSADPDSLGDNRVWDLTFDHNGLLWLATPTGLDRFDPAARRFTHFRHNSQDPQSLGGGPLLALYEDRSGALWISSDGSGLSRYRPAAHRFRLYQPDPASTSGLQSAVVPALLEDSRGALWVGSPEGVLSRLDRSTGEWIHFRHDLQAGNSLAGAGITSLAEDRQGRLWIGTFGSGLDSLSLSSDQFDHHRYSFDDPASLSSNNVSALLVDQTGALWAATSDAGLNRLDPHSGGFTHFHFDPSVAHGLSSDRLTTLLADTQGGIWIGTADAGLSRFDPARGAFRHFRAGSGPAGGLLSDQILSLAESPAGVLWVGTDAGLDRLDLASGTILHFRTQDGLPSDTVNCLAPDNDGNLWIATLNGLARFDLASRTFRTFTPADGLQSAEFLTGACLKSATGELFFGGVQGLNAFDPVEAAVLAAPPPVAISAVKKDNQPVPVDFSSGQPLRFSYRDDSLSFEFAALDFNAGAVQYAYQLVGFDREWVQAGERRFASYTNLTGGEYTFRVKAANRDRVWSEKPALLAISVTPAAWETPWFWLGAALLLTGAAYGGYRLRLGETERRNRLLEERVAELSRQVEEAAISAERSRLARDLHDSVTQSLYSLALLSEAGLRTVEAGQVEESRVTLSRLGEIAQQALQEMRLMVYQLRRPALDETGLAGAIEARLEAVERRAGLQARLVVEGQPVLTSTQESELYSLAQEVLNNALKHSGSASVTVRLVTRPEELTLEVQDAGRGFDPARLLRGGFGLQSMRERAEKLGGRLEIRSAPGQGTSVTCTLPLPGMENRKEATQGETGERL